MKLIGVRWDGDHGVVDLDAKKVIMFAFGQVQCQFFIPTVEVQDAHFNLIIPADKHDPNDIYNEALHEYAVWENMVELLSHPEFNLQSKLNTN